MRSKFKYYSKDLLDLAKGSHSRLALAIINYNSGTVKIISGNYLGHVCDLLSTGKTSPLP